MMNNTFTLKKIRAGEWVGLWVWESLPSGYPASFTIVDRKGTIFVTGWSEKSTYSTMGLGLKEKLSFEKGKFASSNKTCLDT